MAAVAFRRMFGGAVRSTGKRYMSATTQLGTVSMAGTSSFSNPAPEVETQLYPSDQIDQGDIRVLDAIAHRAPNYGLSREFYTDPVFHQADLESIWYKEWVFAAHDADFQKPGDWRTLQIGDYPVLLIKAKDGKIRGFHNVCRHRGHPLCIGSSGTSKKRLKCPYHQWTYDFDGKLAFARDFSSEKEKFDKEDFSLKPVAIESAGGYIFVSVAENPKPFEPMGDVIESYLAPFDLREAKVAYESRVVEEGNWKMVWENNRECYHCKGSHAELVTTFPDGVWWNGLSGTEKERSIVRDMQESCKKMGLPSDFVMSDDAQYRLQRIPLTDNARSFTMDGTPAVKTKRLGRMPFEESVGDVLMYHYPSTWNHFLADHALSFRLLPMSPTKTELLVKWLVPKDAVEGVDYDLDNLTHVWKETNEQDRALVEGNQKGVTSPAYKPGPYNPEHEVGVSQFIDWYCDTIRGNILSKYASDV
mmetsp:Transcript_3257/g.3870  ORF Transcript_3257/g.3870 Transcript_3257/m.3870 type:complete len:474 (-) Transcript_3257:236-1657(-)